VNPQIRSRDFGFAKQFAVADTSTQDIVRDDMEQFDGF
jgi:hypothetical protein